MYKANTCIKCGSKKHTKVGKPISRGADSVIRVRCDKCGQMRMNVIPFLKRLGKLVVCDLERVLRIFY